MSNSISQSFQPSGIEGFRRKVKMNPQMFRKFTVPSCSYYLLPGQFFLRCLWRHSVEWIRAFPWLTVFFQNQQCFSGCRCLGCRSSIFVVRLVEAWLLVAGALFTLIRSGQMFFNGIYPYKYPNGLRVVAFFCLS